LLCLNLSLSHNSVEKLEKSSVTRPKICLAYVSENTYDLLYESMRQALELHFNCDVITYTGTEDRYLNTFLSSVSLFDLCDCELL